MSLQLRSPFDQIKTVQLTLAAATNAHVPVLQNGHLLTYKVRGDGEDALANPDFIAEGAMAAVGHAG